MRTSFGLGNPPSETTEQRPGPMASAPPQWSAQPQRTKMRGNCGFGPPGTPGLRARGPTNALRTRFALQRRLHRRLERDHGQRGVRGGPLRRAVLRRLRRRLEAGGQRNGRHGGHLRGRAEARRVARADRGHERRRPPHALPARLRRSARPPRRRRPRRRRALSRVTAGHAEEPRGRRRTLDLRLRS